VRDDVEGPLARVEVAHEALDDRELE